MYNSFLRLDDGEWVFTDNTTRKVDMPCKAFAVGEGGKFEKVTDVIFEQIGKEWTVREGGEVKRVVSRLPFWQTLVNRPNIPDAFFADLQIACRGCNSTKSLPSSDDVQGADLCHATRDGRGIRVFVILVS